VSSFGYWSRRLPVSGADVTVAAAPLPRLVPVELLGERVFIPTFP
jgi:hypothetical protein